MISRTLNSKKVYDALVNDCALTMENLKKSKAVYVENNEVFTNKIFEFLLERKKIKFFKLPNVLKNTLIKSIDNHFSKTDDEFVERLINNNLIPINYLPIESEYMLDSIIENGFKNNKEREYLLHKIQDYSPKKYCQEDEDRYIMLLGKKYKDCKNIEAVLKVMNDNNLTRDTMSLMEMFALKLYVCKILNNEGINLDIKTFYINQDMDTGAMYDLKKIKLCINGKINTVIDMIDALNHELIHCIQIKNIKECRIDLDGDINILDEKELLEGSYYDGNYENITYEFDAEFKAKMITTKMFGLVNLKFDDMVSSLKKNAKNMVDYSRKKVLKNGYSYTGERNFDHINNLFEKRMRELKNNDFQKFSSMIKKYPIIKYEYTCEAKEDFKRKSVKALLNDIEKCQNKREVGIYYNLLKSRINEDKEDRATYYATIDELEKINKRNNYNEVTNKIIEHLLEVDLQKKDYDNKYRGYFYKNGGNKR